MASVARTQSFEALGCDVVSRSTGSFFECSPLSCNRLATDRPVNTYCLLDRLEDALGLARRCEPAGCEPGPYHVLRVWRERRAVRS